ncbi:uncharacterized protein LOC131153754 [Malania oleifera]|uniref:uncharacterized protein LOC131153754 n=1 Tax=Malania oleifera TaxID=397392 RepID=UPI0025AE312F|nr:uncharacterized protein LOC131153754 [Malania oleifera]
MTILQNQDFTTLVDKATVAEESLQGDLKVQIPKKRLTPSNSYSSARQGKCMWGSGVCYRCGRPGHIAHECDLLGSNAPPQQPSRGSYQAPHGGYHRGTAQARVYSLTPGDAENVGDVVTRIIYMLLNIVVVLFDSRATHSFISGGFVKLCELKAQLLNAELAVATPSGSKVVCSRVIRDFPVEIQRRVLPVSLIVLDMHSFNIIQGMD